MPSPVDGSENSPIVNVGVGSDASDVGHLYAIVQAHLDRYGVREAELARRIGTSPQTVNSWKKRGVRALPDRRLLLGLAETAGVDYRAVLEAALLDAGYLESKDTP